MFKSAMYGTYESMESWKDQLRSRITKPETLAERLRLTAEEASYFERAARADAGGGPGIGGRPDIAVESGRAAGPAGAGGADIAGGSSASGRPPAAPFLPFAVTEYYLSLSDGTPACPIRRQTVPRIEELTVRDYELRDPLGEGLYTAVMGGKPASGSNPCQGADPRSGRIPRLVHRYADRALLLVTDRCAVYCRHCFRRSFTGMGGENGTAGCTGTAGTVGKREIEAAAAYLSAHTEIRELLLSGGDPLTLDDDKLFALMEAFVRKRKGLLFRLCTRMPAVLPARVTPGLVSGLKRFFPVWVVTHFNHPREITPESSEALRTFVDGGIPVANQTVLLRGVNDDPAALYELNSLLLSRGVKPLYLFQGDLAAGTAHLRVPLSRGLRIFAGLRRMSSGLALPRYAVDLPGGGGKVSLEGVAQEDAVAEDAVTGNSAQEDAVSKRGAGKWYNFTTEDGKFYRYPEEVEDMQ